MAQIRLVPDSPLLSIRFECQAVWPNSYLSMPWIWPHLKWDWPVVKRWIESRREDVVFSVFPKPVWTDLWKRENTRRRSFTDSTKDRKGTYLQMTIPWKAVFYKKNGPSRPLFQINVNMSIQHTVLGFEPTTFRTWNGTFSESGG